jgi:hypothetical protein
MNSLRTDFKLFALIFIFSPLIIVKIDPESSFGWLLKYEFHFIFMFIGVLMILWESYKSYSKIQKIKLENLQNIEQELVQNYINLDDK